MLYTRELTDEECQLFGCDPIEWINGAIEGKLNKCKKQKVKQLLLENINEAIKLADKIEKKNSEETKK